MEIDFLNHFKDSTSDLSYTDRKFEISGISLNQIEQLEQFYNNGHLFPKALRELLFLAGDSCYALNRLWYNTQQEIQTSTREWLNEYSKNIARPFL
ncbi:MAG: hypothetical protein V4497_02075 [Bacteroidota bacterium]